MKQLLGLLTGIVLTALLAGQLHAYEVYLPHLTGEAPGWTDYLQVDNDGSAATTYTITLYSDGVLADVETRTVSAYGRDLINLKDLAPSATSGTVSYSGESVFFRVSYAHDNGGLAEFALSDTLKSTIGLYFSDLSADLALRGAAVTNFSDETITVVLYAVGDGKVLGTQNRIMGPLEKLTGSPEDWFPALDEAEGEIKRIVISTRTQCLDGVVIGSDRDLERMIFTSGRSIAGFNLAVNPEEYTTLFYDDFANNDNGWLTGSTGNYLLRIRYSAYFIDYYDTKGMFYTWNAHDKIFDYNNYMIETSIINSRSNTNGWYGLTWGLSDADNFYDFSIKKDGSFGIFKVVDSVRTELVSSVSSAVLDRDDVTNLLKIEKSGAFTTFYINNVPVRTLPSEPLFGDHVGFHVFGDQRLSVQEVKVSVQ